MFEDVPTTTKPLHAAATALWDYWRNADQSFVPYPVETAVPAVCRVMAPVSCPLANGQRWVTKAFSRIISPADAEWLDGSFSAADRVHPADVGQMEDLLQIQAVLHASEARCARLRDGNIRVHAPPSHDVAGALLLAHELGHALLERHQPGSLGNCLLTETVAMAAEHWVADAWLHTNQTQAISDMQLHRAIWAWRAYREYQFLVEHQALGWFEHCLAAWCRGHASPPRPSEVCRMWRDAHDRFGLAPASPNEWWSCAWAGSPLLLRRPGTAGLYTKAWRAAQALVRQRVELRHVLSTPLHANHFLESLA